MASESDTSKLAEAVEVGDRRALARAITLVESSRDDHRRQAAELLDLVISKTGRALRIGISGVPGVGKSTFIEAFGHRLIEQGHRVAVLAIDPSSALSGGSIMGDKTRMEDLSRHDAAFIRPSPTAGVLGGVTRRTREVMLLIEAAGFDIVIVETVGVGQSETAVAGMTDLFLLMLLPGGGDELQGIKRGIMELADLVIVNKADGALAAAASQAATDYAHALTLLQSPVEGWQVPVLETSATKRTGIGEVWQEIGRFVDLSRGSGAFERRRSQQAKSWLWADIGDSLLDRFRRNKSVRSALAEAEAAVIAGEAAPTKLSQDLLDRFFAEHQT
ncbi:MAG: methylmalonyl Co-A mutase-associated GTPase MeaB [Pseudomonadota bacterium]